MPIGDYAGKDWKVIHVEDNPIPSCQVGDDVTFRLKLVKPGEPPNNNLTISCTREGAPTPLNFDGLYDEGSNTIKVGNYLLSLVQCIKLTPIQTTKGLNTGSWTAEDQGPWPADG